MRSTDATGAAPTAAPAIADPSTARPAPAAAPAPVPPPPPEDAATREVRFAVVMYGGVSLCIYINGIAQELLHLVRATAPGDTPGALRYGEDRLEPVERVYRDLGRLLVEGREPGTEPVAGAPVSTRFSVDILSGTSAGGINAIFLAKALTNDESMAQLKQLWMTEGDIAKLINDGGSTRDTGLPRPGSPQALLNGQRMYQKLVMAFEGMDDEAKVQNDGPARAPLVPELDLFVTTTDIAGVTLPIRLADGVVQERRHRGVFHFRYKKEDGVDPPEPNDFSRRYNPFLAFAARCTSAFPFAFEPMRLKHVDEVLDTLDAYRGRPEGRSNDPRWKPFLERFETPEGTAAVPPQLRSFGDGGYLDNKPFSYASEALLGRESAVPVDRKLIYVEPAPEHPERDAARTEFDAIENVMAATVGLPRYETIREDLERLLARNRLTERVRIITQALEDDIPHRPRRQSIEDPRLWGTYFLDKMVEEHGLAYGAYHRLRVAATTDWLARVVSRAAEIGDGSDLVIAVRYLVRAWRDKTFAPHRKEKDTRLSENQFLLDYDLAFRARRMGYMLGKINWLYGWDRQAETAVRQIARHAGGGGATMLASLADPKAPALTEAEKAEFRQELVELKAAFHPSHRQMRRAEEEMLVRGKNNPFRANVEALALDPKQLTELLTLSSTPRDMEAHRLLTAESREGAIGSFVDAVETRVREARQGASEAVERLLDPRRAAPAASPARQLAREVLRHYYEHYADYDMVSFPILYSTDAGEQDTVDVVRISPEDARFIIDEGGDALRRRKLAGTALFSFGGFLRDTWRANDILWGRLDGAERIICSLLPDAADEPIRRTFIERASVAILQDEFKTSTRGEVSRLMSESLVHVAAGRAPESAVSRLSAAVGNEQLGTRLQAVLGDCLADDRLLDYFKKAYEVNRELDPAETLGSLARGSRVVGHMLEGISERHSIEGKRVRWVTRAATWFWSLVQVAVPRSLPSLVFDHWLGLFYALALMLVMVGVFAGPEVMGWGARLLGVALVANVIVLLLRDYMRRRGAVAAFLVGIGVVAAAGVVIAGFAWIAEYVVTRGLERRLPTLLQLEPATRTGTIQGLCMVLGVLMALAAAVPAVLRRFKDWLPGGFSGPGLAAEFVKDADDLAKLTRGVLLKPIPEQADETPEQRRIREQRDRNILAHRKIPKKVIRDVYIDYLFIAAYWILFVLLADRLIALGQADPFPLQGLADGIAGFLGLGADPVTGFVRSVVVGAGIGALVTGTAAAVLDLVENGRIHEAFTAGRGREENWMADGIRTAAVWKWGLVFGTVLLLSPLFLAQHEPRRVLGLFWMNGAWLAVFWIVVAVAGMVSLWKRPRGVEIVMVLLGVGLIAARFLLPAG